MMVPVRLSGPRQLSVDDLIALAVVWQHSKISRRPTQCGTHRCSLYPVERATTSETWGNTLYISYP